MLACAYSSLLRSCPWPGALVWGLGEPSAVAPRADPQADGHTCEHTCTRVLEHTHTHSRCAHGLPVTASLQPHTLSPSLCAGPDSSSALAGCPAPAPLGTAGVLRGATPTGHWLALPLRTLPASRPTAGKQGARPLPPDSQHGSPSSHSAPARSVGSGLAGLWPRDSTKPWTGMPTKGAVLLGAQWLGSRGGQPF